MSNQAWADPGVYEVVPGVHRIPLPLPGDGLKAVNVYVITGPDGPVVIDSGWAIPIARDLLGDGLRELGAEVGDITRFLVTHMHADHYSQAISLRREFGIRVSLGAEERWSLETVIDPGRIASKNQAAHLIALGAADLRRRMDEARVPHDMSNWEPPDDWLSGDDVVETNSRSLDVVPTPGHTRGHVVFHDTANALLFAGDHVLPTITPSIGFEPAMAADPLGSFLTSLAIVRDRPDAMLLPAHGAVTPSVHARVEELVEHHRVRLDAMAAALGWGAETGIEVASKVTWTRRETSFDDLDMFNQFLAVSETGAHLHVLVAQGRATMVLRDGVRHYSLT